MSELSKALCFRHEVTPLRPLKLLFDDVLVDLILGYTKFYSHREKAGISFEITN